MSSIDVIADRILDEAGKKAQSRLSRAKLDAKRIIDESRKSADSLRTEQDKALDERIGEHLLREESKSRASARMRILNAKEEELDKVFKAARRDIAEFLRKDAGYRKRLQQLVSGWDNQLGKEITITVNPDDFETARKAVKCASVRKNERLIGGAIGETDEIILDASVERAMSVFSDKKRKETAAVLFGENRKQEGKNVKVVLKDSR